MHSAVRATLIIMLLAVLTACTGMENIRIVQDRPQDIELLLEQHEYARIRQLTGRHPEIDTPELQGLIVSRERAYVERVVAEAAALEADDDLRGAVQLLSVALQRVPHDEAMRTLRNQLEKERLQELRRNEREQLITRANYMLEQQALYEEQINLAPPSIGQRWENLRIEKETARLAAQLLEHGEYAMLQNDLDIARTCLQLSQRLDPDRGAQEMLAKLQSLQSSREEVQQKKANIDQAKKERKIQRTQRRQTEELLAETQKALEKNRLQEARAAFVQIPAATSNSSEVMAIKDNLNEALNKHVFELIAAGDSLYRADNVDGALEYWIEAQSLDPENQKLQERIDRANKVLARLEELKRQQQ